MAKNTGSTPSHPVRVEISLRPVAGIAEGQLADLALYQLKLMASHLQLVAGFDELLALETLGFQPFDYQIRPRARPCGAFAAGACWPTKWAWAKLSRRGSS